MLDYWLVAFGLMLIIEGMMPFLFPALWRATLRRVSQLQDGQLRFIGLTLMLAGVLVIYWVT
ncbi:MAG TPA: DUF2065 domain-containing protein [Gallionellaceae bacterium]|nr:DUF2065 domain-containing protein [Gallionellaceae bacterium]